MLRTLTILTNILVAFVFGVVACEPIAVITELPIVTETPAPERKRSPVIRFAIFSDITTTNVWALFDKAGASYSNYAVQGGYWASLYSLSDQRFDFIPSTADGFPSEFLQEGDHITSMVNIRPGLKWSDGSELTAEDVAFTANTSLTFELGLNWHAAYEPDYLDYVEAVDPYAVKYFFKKTPGLSEWQYGTLLGPIVSKTYWAPRIVEATALLPTADLQAAITKLEDRAAVLQQEIDDLIGELSGLYVNSSAFKAAKSALDAKQGDLNSIEAKTESKQADYLSTLAKAQAALYNLENVGEPTFGPWKFSRQESGRFVENVINLYNPFIGVVVEEYASGAYRAYKEDGTYAFTAYGEPTGDKVLQYKTGPFFERALYNVYNDEASAAQALRKNEADIILTPYGLSPSSVKILSGNPNIKIVRNRRSDIRFLAFNHVKPHLTDRALRQAIACVIDPTLIAQELLQGQAEPADMLVPESNSSWYNGNVPVLCRGMDTKSRLSESVRILKDAGYTWDKAPLWEEKSGGNVDPGQGLRMPTGQYFPKVILLAPDADYDPLRASTAKYIEQNFDLWVFL